VEWIQDKGARHERGTQMQRNIGTDTEGGTDSPCVVWSTVGVGVAWEYGAGEGDGRAFAGGALLVRPAADAMLGA